MESKTISALASWITIVTGIIALGNFGFSLFHTVPGVSLNIPTFPNIILPFRLVTFILLETALGYAFGWALVKSESFGHGVPMILVWVIGIISAWTSMFNVQWMLTGGTPAEFSFLSVYTIWFGLLSLLALILAIYLIYLHVKANLALQGDEGPASAYIQGGCFAVMFFIFLYGG